MRDGAESSGAAGEAGAVAVQPAPGAVFVSLRLAVGRAFAELTVGEALALRQALDECIGVAAASAERGPQPASAYSAIRSTRAA